MGECGKIKAMRNVWPMRYKYAEQGHPLYWFKLAVTCTNTQHTHTTPKHINRIEKKTNTNRLQGIATAPQMQCHRYICLSTMNVNISLVLLTRKQIDECRVLYK